MAIMNWKTYGHEGIKNILELQLSSGNLAHAYLFFGPEGVGKKMLALELAAKILGLKQDSHNLNTHPDFKILDEEGEISIESMRLFTETLSYKPFLGKKVAIINNAHLMNNQSSNALLKTLEEPSDSTIIILISANKNLLPTIVSRCQTFSANLFTDSQLLGFAETKKINAGSEVLALSFGSISRLMHIQEEENFAKEKQVINDFEHLKSDAISDRLLSIGKLAEQEIDELKHTFTSWLMWEKQQVSKNPTSFKIMEKLLMALEGLNTNKNKKLILQSLFLGI